MLVDLTINENEVERRKKVCIEHDIPEECLCSPNMSCCSC